MSATDCPCQDPADRERVEQMIKLARTKADLVDLVRMLDNRNVALQRVRDRLGVQLAQARLNNPHNPSGAPR